MSVKLSIITVNLNNAPGLERTIKSIAAQSNKNFEYVVVDGDSNDGSKQVLEKYNNSITLSISEKDNGIYEAMNKGIKRSTGEYLLFLNSGDYLAGESVVDQVLPKLSKHDVISGDIDIFDQGIWHQMQSEDQISVDVFLRMNLYHQSTFISRALFDRQGLYDESFRSTGDYEFFIRCLLAHNSTYHHLPITISKFHADGMSNDARFAEINNSERKRSLEKHFSRSVINEMEIFYKESRSEALTLARRIHKIFR